MVQCLTHSPLTKVRALLDVFPPLHSLPPSLGLTPLPGHPAPPPWPHLPALFGALLGAPLSPCLTPSYARMGMLTHH
jgi:hypothetical protein